MLQESDKVHFVFIRRNGLYFVAVTKFNVAPACALELIGRSFISSHDLANTIITHVGLLASAKTTVEY